MYLVEVLQRSLWPAFLAFRLFSLSLSFQHDAYCAVPLRLAWLKYWVGMGDDRASLGPYTAAIEGKTCLVALPVFLQAYATASFCTIILAL